MTFFTFYSIELNVKREKLPLTSDQLELLLAFESTGSLSAIADLMGRDPSVISRNLQRLAEECPVLKKQNGRWRITPLGRQVSSTTRAYLEELGQVIPKQSSKRKQSTLSYESDRALLLIINAQLALSESMNGRRNNSEAERNIHKLLVHWRRRNRPIAHIKHVSGNPESPFFRKASTTAFIPLLAPMKKENVIEKSKASTFAGTTLAEDLQKKKIETLVIVGFTGNECIDATAKQACDLGFTSFVVGDATASFDISGPEGRVLRADRVHRIVLANLNAMFAKVIETDALLRDLDKTV